MKAIWNGKTVAESDQTILIEGNHYFPPDSLAKEYFQPTDTRTTCPWKGQAYYYSLQADGKTETDAAWRYPETITERAKPIEGYVAFYRGKVEVVE